MKKTIVIAIALALLFSLCFASTVFADDGTNDTVREETRYQFEQAKAYLDISGGIATAGVRITPYSGVTLSYVVMTVELVKESTGTTIQSWSGTYYPNVSGNIEFLETQALYNTGGYYVRATGTAYRTSGAYEPFSATSATVTY